MLRIMFVFVILLSGPLACKITESSGSSEVSGTSSNSRFTIPLSKQLYYASESLSALGLGTSVSGGRSTCGGGSCHGGKPSKEKFLEWVSTGRKVWERCFNNAKSLMPTGGENHEREIKCLQSKGEGIGFLAAGLISNGIKKRFHEAYGFGYRWNHWRPHLKKYMMPPFDTTGDNPNSMDDGPIEYNPRRAVPNESFELLWRWAMAGTPKIDEVWGSLPAYNAGNCDDRSSRALLEQIAKSDKMNWMKSLVRNDRDFTPFACGDPNRYKTAWSKDPIGAPIKHCFKQKTARGTSIFPQAHEYGFDWSPSEYRPMPGDWKPVISKVRILSTVPGKTAYWTRSSADGRFIGNGGEGGLPKAGSCSSSSNVIIDLRATLDSSFRRKHILVNAKYDPGFFPSNKGFTWITSNGGAFGADALFCEQKLLEDPNTRCIDVDGDNRYVRNSCTIKGLPGTYQNVGGGLDGQEMVVVRGSYENDDGANSRENDPPVSSFIYDQFDPTGKMPYFEVYPFQKNRSCRPGQQDCPAYVFGKKMEKPSPGEGDWTVSPSSGFLISRSAASDGSSTYQKGYNIRKLVKQANGSYSYDQVGTVCLRGGKASVSFNDRIMAVHHYPSDKDNFDRQELGVSVDDFKKNYHEKTSNIYLADLCSGKKTRITKMGPGQFALYPHFRADGWLYFLVRDTRESAREKSYVVATDAALRFQSENSCAVLGITED